MLLGTAEFVNRADIRMIYCGRRACLALEARTERGITDLNRDVSVKPRVAGFPDLPHTAPAKKSQNFEMAEFIAGLRGHDAGIIS